ncbi:MAG TPA: ABC transporter substrate-binding protein [Gaiellaceae bacterium]|jgi:alpha-glucoside transport system substrate-binding protein|nr:ABC transporter substrate-binding protein [Gaiellaceae bacterium]
MRRKSLIASALAIAILAAGLTATAISAKPTKKHAGSIEVLSLWGGSEKDAFLKVTAAFTKKTGIKVEYTSARDFIPEVRTRLAAGNPPDIGILPRPGYIGTLAKQGALKTLSSLGLSNSAMAANYSAGWLKLGSSGGKLYGVPAKANSKSVIWYKPNSFKKYKFKIPKTWNQLLAITKKYKAKGLVPWSVGAGPSQSQWTLTDWFENIYARTAGPAKYQALFTGKLKFTDPSVANAARIMTQIINNKYVLNGVQGVLGQSFVGSITDVFGTSPKAQLFFEGGFVGGIALSKDVNPSLKPGVSINSFPWPTIKASLDHPVVGAADFAAAFKDNADVRAFLKYISTGAAGSIWVSTGAVTSPNKKVPAKSYPSILARGEAKQLATAKTFLFDGSDLLPGAFGDTWGFALQDVIQKPGNIKSILSTFQNKIQGQF